MGLLKGKTAFVTGSSSGIGAAIAKDFALEGANVVVTYFHGKDKAEQMVKDIESLGVKSFALQANVAEESETDAAFGKIVDEFGDFDILVNSAGVNSAGVLLGDMSTEEWERVIHTNLYGPFFAIRAFLRMKKRLNTFMGSRIINITSIHQFVNRPETANYNASKAAMRNLAYSAALDYAATGLTINNVAPGMILTPINQKVINDPEAMKRVNAIIPMHRGGKPEEVAALVSFLASEKSAYITGATFTIDGGLSILGQNA